MAESKRFIAFIALFTAAALLTEIVQKIGSVGWRADWNLFLAISPIALVCFFFGRRTENSRQLFIFPLAAALIIVSIDALEMLFGLKSYRKTVRDFNGSLLIYLFCLFIVMTGISMVFIGLGKFTTYLSKIIFKKNV